MSKSDYNLFQKVKHDAKGTSTLHEPEGASSNHVILISDDEKEGEQGQLKYKGKSIEVKDKSILSKLKHVSERKYSPRQYKLNYRPEVIDKTLENGMNTGVSVKNKYIGHYLVPGSSSVSWNEIEEVAFTIGLHIFGKNFVLVKNFIGNKTMNDIQTFYYGKFYQSENYRRWDEYMKIDGEKCNAHRKRKCGRKCERCRKRNFTRPWKKELLSRLQLYVPETSHNKFMEVSKTVFDKKMPLEESFFTLKDLVGLNSLVKAFGFGNENDLMLIIKDSMKSSHAATARPKVRANKDFSRLPIAEIIQLLRGDSRRSKTQSSELFWEAIWPRLLARGWRSEQFGMNNMYALSHGPLHFIVPGVEKVSRKLVKGTHYFDSISDVLGQVALKPHLIEQNIVGEKNLGWEYSPDHLSHCHLQPQTLDASSSVMRFNIMDTSMRGEKVAELKSLPIGVKKDSTFGSCSLSVFNKEVVPVAYSFGPKDELQLKIKMDLNLTDTPEVQANEPSKAKKQSVGTGMKLDDHRVDEIPTLNMDINRKRTRPSQSTIKEQDSQSHCHLQPQTLDASSSVMRFNIVDTSMRGEKVAELKSLPNGVKKDSSFGSFSLSVFNKEVVPVAYSFGTKDELQLKIKMGINLTGTPEVEANEPSKDKTQSIDTGMKSEDHRVDEIFALNMDISRKRTRHSQSTIKILEDLAYEMSKAKTKRKGIRYLQDKLGIKTFSTHIT